MRTLGQSLLAADGSAQESRHMLAQPLALRSARGSLSRLSRLSGRPLGPVAARRLRPVGGGSTPNEGRLPRLSPPDVPYSARQIVVGGRAPRRAVRCGPEVLIAATTAVASTFAIGAAHRSVLGPASAAAARRAGPDRGSRHQRGPPRDLFAAIFIEMLAITPSRLALSSCLLASRE